MVQDKGDIMKKYIKMITGGLLVCSFALSNLINTFADEDTWKMQTPGVYKLLDGSTLSGIYARGIDVSFWQGDIDWKKVAADDIKFAMLGTRRKNGSLDAKFEYNAEKAVKNGIKMGVYIYSYADTVEKATEEADYVINLIKDYPISYPVAFDAEDSETLGKLSKSEISDIILAFCNKIRAAGYYPIVYANDYWLANKIDLNKIKDFDIWVAKYNTRHVYQNPAMWQATSKASVDGISGNVDLNFQYKDFTNLIPSDTWRLIKDNSYYYKDFVMQKNTWINDGKNYYYMDKEGLASKGWFKEKNFYYYLDDKDGKMQTSWKNISDAWYYFDDNGRMQISWIKDKDKWYYLSKDGKMQTSWQDIGGEKYYFAKDGSMQTGFINMDNKTYFLEESGVLKKDWINTNSNWYFADKDGVIQKSWFKNKDKWYFMDNEGRMQTSWQNINGVKYYFDPSGAMQLGAVNIGEALYYFNENGALVTNSHIEYNSKSYDIDSDGKMIEKKASENDSSDTNTENKNNPEAKKDVKGPDSLMQK